MLCEDTGLNFICYSNNKIRRKKQYVGLGIVYAVQAVQMEELLFEDVTYCMTAMCAYQVISSLRMITCTCILSLYSHICAPQEADFSATNGN